jgi:hypothetical protein
VLGVLEPDGQVGQILAVEEHDGLDGFHRIINPRQPLKPDKESKNGTGIISREPFKLAWSTPRLSGSAASFDAKSFHT